MIKVDKEKNTLVYFFDGKIKIGDDIMNYMTKEEFINESNIEIIQNFMEKNNSV